MKTSKIYFGICLLTILGLINCTKEDQDFNQNEVLGVWISLDKSDTLDFETPNDFYKSNGFMKNDHYDYQAFNDSIEIGYRGKLFVLITPTKHKFSIENDKLIIDFTNKSCYGFNDKITTYEKE
jgi:hypothetical protein